MEEEIPTELNEQDAANLIAMINKTPTLGGDAEVVSMLKYKLSKIKNPTPKKDKKKDKT